MKSSLVTGGSRGIGRAICIKLAELGYHVIINYKGNETAANETLELVKAKGATGELLKFDVASKEEIQSVLGTWIETNTDKVIEVLVTNAGIKNDVLMFWMKDDQWNDVVRTSLDGFFYTTRLVV